MTTTPTPNSKGKLYLIPNLLGGNDTQIMPPYIAQILAQTEVFIVENVKDARRFLVKMGVKQTGRNLDELTFLHLDKHLPDERFAQYLQAAEHGKNIGLISDAGCPAIADPGSLIVQWAHQKNIEVAPLVGPSSLLLALMASGLNGQQFAFSGYLPIQQPQRGKFIRLLENRILTDNQTQLFIETPYRNQSLFADILQTCKNQLKLCIAANLTLPNQYIQTLSIAEWKKMPPPALHKIPTVFVMGI